MRSLDEAVSQFAYHPATPDSAHKHAVVRDLFVNLLPDFWEQVPDGPEKTLAVRKLQEALMYANLAIALTVPADMSETRGVARALSPQGILDGITHVNPASGYTRVEAQS